jgi:RES domain-containing protein
MPTGWRISKTRYATSAFDGEGARLYGGRWSSPGTRIVYTSSTRALAILEVLVHLGSAGLLPNYSLCSVDFGDDLMERVDRSRLPSNWRDYPAPNRLQAIGDEWIRGRSSVVLAVPSAVEGTETNYLLNPAHQDFAALSLNPCAPYPLDGRLLTR